MACYAARPRVTADAFAKCRANQRYSIDPSRSNMAAKIAAYAYKEGETAPHARDHGLLRAQHVANAAACVHEALRSAGA